MQATAETGERVPSVIGARFWIGLILIATAAMAVRTGGAIWWQQRLEAPDALAMGDSDGYLELSRHLARGEPYQYGWVHAAVFRAPGYPCILAPIWWVGDREGVVVRARLWTAALSLLSVVLAGWWSASIGGPRCGWLAAALVAVYPETVALSFLILAEAAFAPWMMATLIAWSRALEGPAPRLPVWAAGCGLAAALAALVRPSWLLFLPCLVLAAFAIDPRRTARAGGIALLICALAMLPWWIRNHRVTGHFVPTTLQTGASLRDGWHPAADGSSDMDFVWDERLAFLDQVEGMDRDRPIGLPPESDDSRRAPAGRPADDLSNTEYWSQVEARIDRIRQDDPRWSFEYAFDRYLRERAIAWARQNPGQAIRLAAAKIARLWSPFPRTQLGESRWLGCLSGAAYLAVLALAVLGGWRMRQRPWLLVVWLAPAIYFTLLHSVFVSSIRYREPVMVVMTVPAAIAIHTAWAGWTARRSQPRTPSAPN